MSSKKATYGLFFGRTIESEVAKRRMSKKAFAEHFDMSQTTATNWFSGQLPSLEHVLEIVDFLDLSLDQAFGRTPGTVSALRKIRAESAALCGAIDCVLPDESIAAGVRKEVKKAAAGESKPRKKKREKSTKGKTKR